MALKNRNAIPKKAILKVKDWIKNTKPQFEWITFPSLARRLKDSTGFKSGNFVNTPRGVGKLYCFNHDLITISLLKLNTIFQIEINDIELLTTE